MCLHVSFLCGRLHHLTWGDEHPLGAGDTGRGGAQRDRVTPVRVWSCFHFSRSSVSDYITILLVTYMYVCSTVLYVHM